MTPPSYPEYKGSNVKWLAQIPSHWEVVPGRRLFEQRRDQAFLSDEQLSATQKYGVIPQSRFIELEDQKVTLALGGLDNFKHVEVNNFVISLRSFQGGIEWSRFEGCVSPAYTVLRSRRQIHASFWAYLLKSTGYISELQSVTDGIRDGKSISYDQFGIIGLPVPGDDEQSAIATFLDRETGKIDLLVAEQERLIELLKEKRQAVISHAVTNGLDPNVPTKSSGVEWLGKLPAHWDVRPLMYLTAEKRPIMYGIVLPGPNVEQGVRIVKGGDVKSHRLKKDLLCCTTPEIEAPFARARLLPNDIVYSIRGTIGDVELVPEELAGANITQDVARISPRSDFDHLWLLFALRADQVFTQLKQRSLGAAVPGVNIFDLKRARIPVPPIDEQKAIAEHLRAATSSITALLTETQRAIDLLKERRSALISAAVTGKFDVRGLVATEATEAA